jgi:hypothetical protein
VEGHRVLPKEFLVEHQDSEWQLSLAAGAHRTLLGLLGRGPSGKVQGLIELARGLLSAGKPPL